MERWVTHYRAPFYDALRTELRGRDIELRLVHGPPPRPGEPGDKADKTNIAWAVHVPNRWLRVGSRRLLWQPATHLVRDDDLVIVEQASTRLLNYVLLARQAAGATPVALWGHGKNFKEHSASRSGEALKRWVSRRPHWWFAYNSLSVEVVRDLGFPPERITDVQNAIDTRGLTLAAEAVSAEDIAALRARLGVRGDDVGIFVGGMYAEKRLGFLVEACQAIRARLPTFEMLFLGAGAGRALVSRAAADHSWIHDVGPVFGLERATYFALAKLFLLPGLVGLAVLDSFALGVPLVTVGGVAHSPEVAYLRPGHNGVMLPAGSTPQDYADEVVRLLRDEPARARLVAGCVRSREEYTLEAMVSRFAGGVEDALRADRRRW